MLALRWMTTARIWLKSTLRWAAGWRQFLADRPGLQQEAAAAGQLVEGARGDAVLDVGFPVGQQVVEGAGNLAGVAGDFRHALLVVVQFLQGHDGEEDVVFLETVQAAGVVHQHVGVEHEILVAVVFLAADWRGIEGFSRGLGETHRVSRNRGLPGMAGHL